MRDIGVTGVQTCALPIFPEYTVAPGDIMEYKLSLTNTGTATAYNTVVNDVINVYTSFINEGNPNIYVTSHGIGWNPNQTILSGQTEDRKSTRLNSSHANISYAVFCLKKKNIN